STVEWLIATVAPNAIWIPPPFASSPSPNGNVFGTAATTADVLPSIAQSSIVIPPLSAMPPPSVNDPFGGLTAARLPVTEQCRRTSVPCGWLAIPPPPALLSSAGLAGVDPAVLFVTSVSSRVRKPELSMPPPPTKAQACGPNLHEKPPCGIVVLAVTR